MTYIVTWSTAAFHQLSQLEAAADDKQRIRKAGEWVDYTLRRVPVDMGESRDVGFRVWYGDVLGVYYHVDQDAMKVRVIGVALSRRK